jgi:hypothetical protein
MNWIIILGRDSSVGVATRYGLDGPGIESVLTGFSKHVQTGPGTHLASYKIGNGSLFYEQSGQGVALTIHTHLAPGLKKEKSYTSTTPLRLHGLF